IGAAGLVGLKKLAQRGAGGCAGRCQASLDEFGVQVVADLLQPLHQPGGRIDAGTGSGVELLDLFLDAFGVAVGDLAEADRPAVAVAAHELNASAAVGVTRDAGHEGVLSESDRGRPPGFQFGSAARGQRRLDFTYSRGNNSRSAGKNLWQAIWP